MKTHNTRPRIVVLISGSGSNLQALLDAKLEANFVAVISNKAQAKGLERAQQQDIPTVVIDHTQFASREQFDEALASQLTTLQPDLILLAGFMRILSPNFVTKFLGKLVNIHPSLMPKYPGLHTHQRAIDAGDSHAGATIHFVTPELDGGPGIAQAQVAIKADDDAQTLAQRVLTIEHRLYPFAVSWIINNRIAFRDNQVFLDETLLPHSGQDITDQLAK